MSMRQARRVLHAEFSESTAATFTVATAPSGYKVRVVNYHLVSGGTNTVQFADSTLWTNEVQTVTVTDGATTDSFTLTYSGQTTSSLDWDATAAEVLAALEALSNIGVGDVDVSYVSAADGGVYTITFQGALAHTNVAQLTSTPTGCSVAHATTTAGVGTNTALSGAMPVAANGQLVAVGSAANPLLEAAAGESLLVVTSGAQTLDGYISYTIDGE